ncbi:MAG: 6-pyruvoyl-tetrahydropterin synthase-related protein [Actinomycetota bacterium]
MGSHIRGVSGLQAPGLMNDSRIPAQGSFWRPCSANLPAPAAGGGGLRRLVRQRPVFVAHRFTVAFDRAVFLGITLVLLAYFPLDLLLSVTTTTGGDTGAHVYTPWYLRENLLPQGKIMGWSPGWYGGFPIMQFYFPLVSLFQALLSFVISYEVAFKIGSVLGTFFLPLGVYICFRLLRFSWPTPALGAVASLGFLLMDSYSIYGGNIPSSLSGEYAYALSLGLSLVFLGLMYRLATDPRGRPVVAACVLALAVLSHLLPVIVAVIILPLFFYWAIRTHGLPGAIRRFVIVGGLAFALTSFWSIPFLARLRYTTDMRWVPLAGWDPVFPRELWPYLGGLALASLVALVRRDRRLLIFQAMALVGITLYLWLPPGSVWNGRFLPFYYLAAVVSSAYFASAFVGSLSRCISVRWMGMSTLVLGLALGATMGSRALNHREQTYIDGWIRDNYLGYESRKDFPAFKALNDRLAELPPGRVFWEPNDLQVKFGTPIALMSIPYWSGQPTMEGINYESSMTTPFHFLTAAEVAEKPANPIPGLPYGQMNLVRGARHMELLDVRYYLAFTQPAKDAAAATGLEKMQEIGEFSLFKVDSPGQVVIPAAKPLPFDRGGSDWVHRNVDWFDDLDGIDRPLVRVSKKEWERVARIDPPARAQSVDAEVDNDQIRFTTEAVGQPHWVKTSYFPNWKVDGAEGPYLASPSMMMVVPTQRDVHLYYARTWAEWLGIILTVSATIAVLVPRLRRRVSGKAA